MPSISLRVSGSHEVPNASTTTLLCRLSVVTVPPSIARKEKSVGRSCAHAETEAATVIAVRNDVMVTALRILVIILCSLDVRRHRDSLVCRDGEPVNRRLDESGGFLVGQLLPRPSKPSKNGSQTLNQGSTGVVPKTSLCSRR